MKLQPLRIEAGWEVSYNLLYDVDPIKGNETYFEGSSLLILKNTKRLKFIEVCWRPELDLNGEYQIEVLHFLENFNSKTNEFDINPIWDLPCLSYATKSRIDLVEKLEELMRTLPVYKDPRILQKRGLIDQPSESLRIQLNKEGLSDKLIKQIIRKGNAKIQSLLLDHIDIKKETVLLFSTDGINKKVKNKAKQKLASKAFRS